ncbi:MAG: hypothetical protein BWZ03_00695 [bacterium ADurb.BinA186]|nr:MAG: hypothetical protein BWZ03_00695 [bacterium ADurb.BinA186]
MMQSINAIRVMMLTYCGQNLPNTQITTVIPKSEWEKIKRIIYPEGSRAPINAKINRKMPKDRHFSSFDRQDKTIN